MKYAGVGPRATPWAVMCAIKTVGIQLCQRGLILRSGNAIGADKAFAHNVPPNMKEIFHAQDANIVALHMAAQFHPQWHHLSNYVKRLMARNCQILFGRNLDDPVSFVISFYQDKSKGGTGHTIRVAEYYGVTVYNLADYLRQKHIVGTLLEDLHKGGFL